MSISPGQVFGRGVASATDRAKLTMADATALEQQAQLITAVEPEMQKNAQVQYLNKNTNTTIIGTTANYLEVRKYEHRRGPHVHAMPRTRAAGASPLLGDAVAQNLGVDDGAALVGETVRIQGIQFRSSACSQPKGRARGFGNPDDQVLIPITTGALPHRRYGPAAIHQRARAERQRDPGGDGRGRAILRRQHRLRPGQDDDFKIRNQSDFLNTLGETTQMFTYLLAGIAAVSLLVGGIGIMNIMLVSVTERTREIGMRKALGATRLNILLQFLIEAVVLCMLGGIGGILHRRRRRLRNDEARQLAGFDSAQCRITGVRVFRGSRRAVRRVARTKCGGAESDRSTPIRVALRSIHQQKKSDRVRMRSLFFHARAVTARCNSSR